MCRIVSLPARVSGANGSARVSPAARKMSCVDRTKQASMLFPPKGGSWYILVPSLYAVRGACFQISRAVRVTSKGRGEDCLVFLAKTKQKNHERTKTQNQKTVDGKSIQKDHAAAGTRGGHRMKKSRKYLFISSPRVMRHGLGPFRILLILLSRRTSCPNSLSSCFSTACFCTKSSPYFDSSWPG